jgi:IPT/TIG domain
MADEVAAAAPVVRSISPASGTIGAEVTITGSGFAEVTAVRLGGAASEFTVNSAYEIIATMPRYGYATAAGAGTPRATGAGAG